MYTRLAEKDSSYTDGKRALFRTLREIAVYGDLTDDRGLDECSRSRTMHLFDGSHAVALMFPCEPQAIESAMSIGESRGCRVRLKMPICAKLARYQDISKLYSLQPIEAGL